MAEAASGIAGAGATRMSVSADGLFLPFYQAGALAGARRDSGTTVPAISCCSS
jgi:hypothetical protein